MFGLIDGNNFYASCERVFRPELRNLPVVVLSNNDGCVIARSNESKKIGIPMGAPAFQWEKVFKENNVNVFSANFILYGDLSNRMVNICRRFCQDIEVYSIDEAFLDFHGYQFTDLQTHCEELRFKIFKGLDIPTSIGVAPTKTLAKVANKIAKKYPVHTNSVYILDSPEKIDKALKWFPIQDVWGIGSRYYRKFERYNIKTAWDFAQLPQNFVHSIMGIVGVRMHNELNGISQYGLSIPGSKKSIATTRTFDKVTDNLDELKERISTFAFKCSEKLRSQNSCCLHITVFIRTNFFKEGADQYSNSITVTLPSPSNSAIEICKYASKALESIYKNGYLYKKAGVILSSFVPDSERIISLFDTDFHEKHLPIMNVIDFMNKRLGSEKIKLASMDIQKTWKMNQKNLSKRYSTELNDVIIVKA
ncbi:SOS mutagenesis and repair protein UmuC [Elizabethkingia anophelis]|nr:SOS mutagenesis and repair protein UmuC [Elizabethkingia anophelis]